MPQLDLDTPENDPLGAVRIFPRSQDINHPRQLAIRWTTPTTRDEQLPWILLDTDGAGPQRLSNDSVRGCEPLPLSMMALELGHPWPPLTHLIRHAFYTLITKALVGLVLRGHTP